jgi:hypothetical protein
MYCEITKRSQKMQENTGFHVWLWKKQTRREAWNSFLVAPALAGVLPAERSHTG